jgi:hypothetical protein
MKLRPLGDVLLDMELLLDEMLIHHDLQHGDVLALIYSHMQVHNPKQKEEYEDGTHPIYYYGPKENL